MSIDKIPKEGRTAGWFIFVDGIHTQQSYNITESYPILFGNENFDRCIVIGTFFGGLEVFIRRHLDFYGDIISYDIVDHLSQHPHDWFREVDVGHYKETIIEEDVHGVFAECDIYLRLLDVFSEGGMSEISQLISQPGKTLLICDGGNKAKEIEIFSKYLKSGDIVIGHDYFKDGIVDDTIWLLCELDISMISTAIDNNNLDADNEYTDLFAKSASFIARKL